MKRSPLPAVSRGQRSAPSRSGRSWKLPASPKPIEHEKGFDMKALTTYLNFDGTTGEAMKFYQKCLGGDLYLMPFSEVPRDYPPEAKDRTMHARLAVGPLTVMASDIMPGMPFHQGNNFSICLD